MRASGENYRVTLQLSGTMQKLAPPALNSDPPLSPVDIVTLLFGDPRQLQDPELRRLRTQQTTEELLASRAARLLTAPIASEVGRVVEQTFGVDTFQLTPLLSDPSTAVVADYADGAGHDRQARVGSRVPDLFAQSSVRPRATRGPVARVRPERSPVVGPHPQRGRGAYSLDVRVRRVFFESGAGGADASRIGLAVLVLAAMLCGGTPLAAQQSETYIGKTVASVRLELEGRALDDATLLALLDTRVGQPLRMAEVRESMAHLHGLGRFQNVEVHATLTPAATVNLLYELVPLHSVRAIIVAGSPVFPRARCGIWCATGSASRRRSAAQPRSPAR